MDCVIRFAEYYGMFCCKLLGSYGSQKSWMAKKMTNSGWGVSWVEFSDIT